MKRLFQYTKSSDCKRTAGNDLLSVLTVSFSGSPFSIFVVIISYNNMLIPEPNFRSSVFIHLFSTFSCIIFILLMIYNYLNYFPMYLPIYSYNSILVSAFFSSASIYSGKGSPIWHSPHMSTPIIFLSFKKNFNRCSSIPRLMCP